LNAHKQMVAGSFTFDTTCDQETGLSIVLTGSAPFSGTCNLVATWVSSENTGQNNFIYASGPTEGILNLY